jgi:hypothetical protein
MANREGIKTLAEKMAELIGQMDAELAQENELETKNMEKNTEND